MFKKVKGLNATQLRTFASCKTSKKFGLPKRLQGSVPSVWNEYVALAAKYKPLNLGQGLPGEDPPQYLLDSLAKIVSDKSKSVLNQYTRGFGHWPLVEAISKLISPLVDRKVDPNNEILVTIGAYEALFTSIVGHVDEGEGVIIIEPFFDCYASMVKMAGGIPRFIPLKPRCKGEISSADWVFDDQELECLFNEKTKMIIINNPHNPTGKVFSCDELNKIADLCKKWNVLCLSDEVYEYVVFDDNEHIRMCTLPEMWERTITIGSFDKIFSVTGWKTGWAYGSANLLVNLQMIHENCVYTCPTLLQEALAMNIEYELNRIDSPESYFKTLPCLVQSKRDFMVEFLKDAGMEVTIPQGGYFILADWTSLEKKADLKSEPDKYRDVKFTKWMTKNVGLQGIPPSAFYSEENKTLGENFVRYCYFKKQENLQKASDILKKWANSK